MIKNRVNNIRRKIGSEQLPTFLLVHNGTSGTVPDGRSMPLDQAIEETTKAGYEVLPWHEEKTYSL